MIVSRKLPSQKNTKMKKTTIRKTSRTDFVSRIVSGRQAAKTKLENQQVAKDRANARMFGRLMAPIRNLVTAWNSDRKFLPYIYAAFKKYGMYHEGTSLLLLADTSETVKACVYLVWDIPTAKVSVAVYSMTEKTRHAYVPDGVFNPKDLDGSIRSLVETIRLISEKDLIKLIMKKCPIQKSDITPLVQRVRIDMTRETSSRGEDWKAAHLELARSGYFDPSDNVDRLLRVAEEQLLPDSQSIRVLATNIRYIKSVNEDEPVRSLYEVTRTVGFFRKLYKEGYRDRFTLEASNQRHDYQMACAIISRNRMPIIIGSPLS